MKETEADDKDYYRRINLDLVDQLLKDYKSPEDVLGENGILKQFTKALLERAMQVEMAEHLGYEKHDVAGDNSGNSRNGSSGKTMKGDFGELPIEVPRDRNAEFESKIVPKGKTRLDGFNDKMLSLYARGIRTREIQQHIQEIYKVEVSPTLISNVTEAVMEDVIAWQNRPLESIYPILYMDALQVKISDGAHVVNKAVHLAIGVKGTPSGQPAWEPHHPCRKQRRFRHLARASRGREAVAPDRHRVEEPWSQRCVHRLRGRTQRFSRSHSRFPARRACAAQAGR
jgi:hypothetical protein